VYLGIRLKIRATIHFEELGGLAVPTDFRRGLALVGRIPGDLALGRAPGFSRGP